MNQAIIVFLSAVLIVGGFFAFRSSPDVEPVPYVETPQVLPVAEVPVTTAPSPVPTASAVKEFTVTGSNFAYAPNTISVKKGDKVKIIFKNADGFHDLKIDEYKVATQKIAGGKEETIEFIADKAGSFEYYCSVGSHRQMGMKGTLVVTE